MATKFGMFLHIGALTCLVAALANAQDAPSLADLARQQRQQREQASVQTSAKKPRVITNEEIPEHADEAGPAGNKGADKMPVSQAAKALKQTAEYWKSQIRAQKSQIAALQQRMEQINSSIRFSSFNCGTNCAVRDERQRGKLQQVDQIQGQIEKQKKQLEGMQEAARKQGYGSSVYDQ